MYITSLSALISSLSLTFIHMTLSSSCASACTRTNANHTLLLFCSFFLVTRTMILAMAVVKLSAIASTVQYATLAALVHWRRLAESVM